MQNFILAFLYMNRMVHQGLLWSLLLFKEFLLLTAFGYSVTVLMRSSGRKLPKPFITLTLFTFYCLVRAGVGIAFLGDGLGASLRMLRMIFFPLEVCSVAIAVTLTRPSFADSFLKKVSYFVVLLAAIGVLLAFFAGPDFWASKVNIASYNLDIKGDDPFSVVEELGVSATGLGREEFLNLLPFRAMGTFGDPLAMGFSIVVPILLLAFYFRRRWFTLVSLLILAAALFLTFSRSAWILLYLACLFVLFKRRHFAWAAAALLIPLVLLLVAPPLAQFAAEDLGRLSWSSPGGEHAEGIIWFYTRGLTDLGNALGKGMSPEVQKIPESGYAFLLEHFGLFAYGTFLWFLISLFRSMNRKREGQNPLSTISQGIAVGMFIVMHFSQYPFAFIEWLVLWFLLGASMSTQSRPQGLPYAISATNRAASPETSNPTSAALGDAS
jgi:hypothetical protein